MACHHAAAVSSAHDGAFRRRTRLGATGVPLGLVSRDRARLTRGTAGWDGTARERDESQPRRLADARSAVLADVVRLAPAVVVTTLGPMTTTVPRRGLGRPALDARPRCGQRAAGRPRDPEASFDARFVMPTMSGPVVLASAAPLRIAVLGAGKIGSAFAAHLARVGGHEVTVVARPGSLRLQQLERDQAIVDVNGGRARVRVASVLDGGTPYDLVIVTLLAHQADALLPTLQESAARCIQFMFNTFHPERLQAAIGAERCAFGMPFVQATLDGDGRLKATIGAAGQRTLLSQQRWVDVFTAAGLPAALERDMPLWLRCHVPLCVAFESVAVAGERRGGGASWAEALVLARGVHASFRLITGLGYRVYPSAKRRIDGSPAWAVAAMLWTMSRVRSFRELPATGEAECRALVEVMVAAAPLAKPPVRVDEMLAMKPS